VNLRQQLEQATGSVPVVRQETIASMTLPVAGVALLAVLATFTLGPALGARSPLAWAGALATSAILLAPMAFVLRLFRPAIYASAPAMVLLVGLFAVVLAAAAVAAQMVPGAPELVPLALLGVVVSALFDRRMSLVAVMCCAVLVAAQPVYRGATALPVLLIAGGAAALVVRPTAQRDQSYIWMLVITVATSLMLVTASAAARIGLDEVLMSVARCAGVAIASVIVAMLLMPFAERATGRETHLTLLEWGDLNRPLLQRLSLEAPGTYAHTIAIANLAEAACRAIGANALLARVGAYYHDIGKLAKPQYFVENQPRDRNLHDKLKPATSAGIIRNHVREGLELAEAERVPKSIRAFITEHHGTGTISYFLEKARERDGTVGNPADFTYPGPVPQSAETAVVMLADGAEAATRALANPTPDRIREVIESVVRQRLEQGQLRDAPLTMRQLGTVKREFARVLGGMYHGRVDYPTPAPTMGAIPQ
jgi:putative nucleotidyltransferase with HDIG domain